MSILIKDGNAPKDKRDYIVKEHEIEVGDFKIEQPNPYEVGEILDYHPDKEYDVALVEDTCDITGTKKYYWIVDKDHKRISQNFSTAVQANQWMQSMIIHEQVKRSKR